MKQMFMASQATYDDFGWLTAFPGHKTQPPDKLSTAGNTLRLGQNLLEYFAAISSPNRYSGLFLHVDTLFFLVGGIAQILYA